MPCEQRWRRSARALLLALAVIASAPHAVAEEVTPAPTPGYADSETVGIDEKLGATLPAGLMFKNTAGETVELTKLLQRPTILTLVYLRCPGICSPLMNELAKTVDEVKELKPGVDYDVITVSFDAREGPELAATGKKNLIGRMKTEMPPDAWRFLTGDERNIARLTDAVGFRFQRDKEDFKHAGTVIFLTKDGLIVRYLSGMAILPFDMKMAVNDAAQGTPRSLMQRLQQLCYAYDPEGKTYTLQVNRIVLFVTLFGLGIFVAVLFLRRKRTPAAPPPPPPPTGGAVKGGTA